MNNLSTALYIAAFALIFVIASSVSIYLYGTLFAYIKDSNEAVKVVNRAESIDLNNDYSNFKRDIGVSEIYILLSNMEQMHVYSITIKQGNNVIASATKNDVDSNNYHAIDVLNFLKSNSTRSFLYSSKIKLDDNGKAYSDVTYTLR